MRLLIPLATLVVLAYLGRLSFSEFDGWVSMLALVLILIVVAVTVSAAAVAPPSQERRVNRKA